MSDEELFDSSNPGIGRLYYFLARILMILVMVFVISFFGPESGLIRPLELGIIIAAVVLDVLRLRNIGVSQWFIFLRFVPYVGLLLSIGLQTAQTGGADTKRLDRAGWAILGTHAAIFSFMLYLLCRMNVEVQIFSGVFGQSLFY